VAIEGYEGFYEIDRDGHVFSLDRIVTTKRGPQYVRGRSIKAIENRSHGYFVVNLAKNGVTRQYRVHILVAKAFIENPDSKRTVNHGDAIKSHNWVDNLSWATHQEQMDHAVANGLMPSGDRNGSVKLLQADLVHLKNRVLTGELIQNVAASVGVDRNTVSKALTKAFGSSWDGSISAKRSRAAQVRYGTYSH
jgi:hypothetical protein